LPFRDGTMPVARLLPRQRCAITRAALPTSSRSSSRSSGRQRRGFTLIELMMVVVIIGILALIVLPKFEDTKGKSYIASMKTDLRNLATAEESYFYDTASYTTDISALKFQTSPLVSVTLQSGDVGGWSAQVSHPRTPVTCALFVGNVTPVAPATQEGALACQ
jgi:prepilin-type N-terminal cleavage/methylation domain-containing protein